MKNQGLDPGWWRGQGQTWVSLQDQSGKQFHTESIEVAMGENGTGAVAGVGGEHVGGVKVVVEADAGVRCWVDGGAGTGSQGEAGAKVGA